MTGRVRWLIDGYNVIRREPDLRGREAESLEAGRQALVRLVAGIARRSADEFVIVFDGARRTGPGETAGQVRVVFSRPPESADDVLRRLAAHAREAGVVVTDDRAVRTAASRAGAVVVGVQQFLGAALGDEGDDDEKGGDEFAPRPGRGNPFRASREVRAARRVLARLRRG